MHLQICAGLGVSVTYQSIDTASGQLQDVTVSAVNLLSADGIRHMVTTVVSNFTSFFPLGTVFTIMIGVGVADGSALCPLCCARWSPLPPRPA